MNLLLDLADFTVELPTPSGWIRPVNHVTLHINAGESLGLVGESGSGKTMLSLALMGLLPQGARVSGNAWLSDPELDRSALPVPTRNAAQPLPNLTRKNLAALNEKTWQQIRGSEIAMIFQEPMTSLNPVMRVGEQIAEAIRAHHPRTPSQLLKSQVFDSLQRAAVPEPETRATQFPHQLSGGLRQRVMIAMALAGGPRLLIADEPTTALDVTVQKHILELLDRLRRELQLGLLFITHDLGVVARVADRIAVLYAGRIVEEGPTQQVLTDPRHPYTQGLLAASPTLERGTLAPIHGSVPNLATLPQGCAFAPRCSYRLPECVREVPEMREAEAFHCARCILV